MRITELLTEASLLTNPNYKYGHVVRVSQSKTGLKLFQKLSQIFPNFEYSTDLEWVESINPSSPVIQLGNGDSVLNFKMLTGTHRGATFRLTGTTSAIEPALNHSGENIRKNRGDLGEGILGAALAAKFVHNLSEDVNKNHVKEIIKSLSDDNTFIGHSDVADKIKFVVRLPGQSLYLFKDENFWKLIEQSGLFDASVHFVNNGFADKYNQEFHENGKFDSIEIISDGVTNQSTTKTDIKVTANNQPLEHLNISLKVGNPILGQVGTGGVKLDPSTWMETAKEVFGGFGVTYKSAYIDYDVKNVNDFHRRLFASTSIELNEILKNPNNEPQFVLNVIKFIRYHATLDDPNIEVVHFDKNISSLHSFADLEHNMQNVNLAVSSGDENHRPTIKIYDVNSPARSNLLLKIRLYVTNKKASYYIEQGPLLKELTRVQTPRPVRPVSKPTTQPPQPTSAMPSKEPTLPNNELDDIKELSRKIQVPSIQQGQ